MRHAAFALFAAATLSATTLAVRAIAEEPMQPSMRSQPGTMPVPADARAAIQDIQKTLGMVPGFFRMFPEEALPGAWASMKAVQLNPESALPRKDKELIGLAVSAQVPCHYCVYFHTQTAKAAGATEAEIRHALALASFTRFVGTWLSGQDLDENLFRRDVDRIAQKLERQTTAGGRAMASASITDLASARRDIEQTFGFVPTHLANLPDTILPAVWSEWKALEMGGPIGGKQASLINLGVAAQIPSELCAYADTTFARAQGASARETQEAVLVAATVRHWSTFLNGVKVDEATFRKEVDQMVTAMKKRPQR